MPSRYKVVSGVVFGVVAALQFVRAYSQWPVSIGNFDMPVWASWVATVVASSLCVWAFRSNSQ